MKRRTYLKLQALVLLPWLYLVSWKLLGNPPHRWMTLGYCLALASLALSCWVVFLLSCWAVSRRPCPLCKSPLRHNVFSELRHQRRAHSGETIPYFTALADEVKARKSPPAQWTEDRLR